MSLNLYDLQNVKIGLITGTLNSGGAERMMVNLAKGFVKKNHEVTFFLVNKTGAFLKELPDAVTVVDLKARFGVKSSLLSIRKQVKNHRPDVLISTQPHINACVNLTLKTVRRKPVVILREANTPEINFQQSSFLYKKSYQAGYSGADHYVAVSEGVRDNMIDYYNLLPEMVTTIYNPVIDDTFNQKFKEPVTHPWLLDREIPVIISMGRMVPQKDHLTLVKAFAEMRNRIQARLIIVGNKEQDREYVNKVISFIDGLGLSGDIDLPGFIANPFPMLREASLFVLSSEYEGLPGSLIQALACGCPVVSTDCPSGPSEILEMGKYGSLVPVGDYHQLSQKMLDALQKEHDPVFLNKRANEFSMDRATDGYLQVIENLIAGKE